MSKNNDVVIIELDRPRELRLGHKAIKTLEALTGKSLAGMDPDSFSSEEIEKVMYCMMRADAERNGEKLELGQMEDLLDLAPYGEIVSKMVGAFNAAFGEEQIKNAQRIAEEKTAKKNGTGMKA